MAKMMIRLGGKWVDLGGIGGGVDKEEILDEAAKYADELKNALDKDVKDLNTALGNTEDYIKGAFKDGIITEVEAAKIAAYLNTLRLTKEDLDKRYEELYSNPWLPTERKKSIQSAKFNFDESYKTLVNILTSAIEDGKITEGESEATDKAFEDFHGALALLSSLLQIAIDEIGSAKAKQAEDNSKDYADGIVGEVTRRVVQNEAEIKKTNKEITLRVTREEFEEGLLNVSTEATRFVVEQKKLFNEDLSNLNGKVQAGKDYTLEAFKDGIIYDAELAKIKEHLDIIKTAKTQFDARYDSVHANEELPADAKKNMEAAKKSFDANYTDLVTTINQVIADQKADPGEIQAVTNKFASFDNATSLVGATIEVGIEEIGKVKQQKALEEAKKYADDLKKDTDKSLGDLQTNITKTENYIKGAFHDGVITEMEAKKIEAYLNTLAESKAKMDAKYAEIYANTFLMGTPKLELYQRKSDQQRAYDSLIKIINDAIADGKTDDGEANAVDMAFYDYNNSVTALSKAFEKAIDNIAQNKANKAEQNANDKTDEKLAPIDTRIKTNTSAIKTLAEEVSIRVTEEIFKKQIGDITEEMGGMETRVSKSEADIRVQAEAINLRVTKETFDNNMLVADWYNQVKSSSPNMIGDWQTITPPTPYEMTLTTLPDGSQGRALRKIHIGGAAKIDNTGWMLPWIDVNPKKTYLLEFYVKALDINSIYYYGREEAKADGTPNDQGNGPYIVAGRTPNEEDVKAGKWVKHFAVIPPHDAGETNSHVTTQSTYTPDHEDKFWNSESVKIQPKVYLTYNVQDIKKNSEMFAWGFGLYEVGSVGNLFQSVNQASKSAKDAQSAADTAGKAAKDASDSAVKANKLLDDISSDNKLTPMEKTELKREWDSLVAEKPSLEAEATLYKVGVEKTNYVAAYTDAEKFITPFIADLSTTQDVNGETLRTKTKALYTARSVLRQRISQIADEAAKAAAAEAQAAKDMASNVGQKLDNMQVGGRNMELNTASNAGTWTNPGTSGYPQKFMKLAEYSKVLMRGKEITISFKLKGKVTAFGTTNKYIGHELAVTFADGTIGYYTARADTQIKLNTDYSLSTFSGTFSIPDKTINDVKSYALCRDMTGTVELSEYKIEIGNKATDWSPAPEDVTGQISTEVDNQVGSQMNGFNNLFRNSGNFKTLNGWVLNGGKSVKIVQKEGLSVLEAVGSIASTNTVTFADLKPSTEYVYSMELMFSKDTPITQSNPMHFWFFDNGNNNGAFDSIEMISKDAVAKANTWTRISLKFKTKATLSAAAYFKAFVYGATQLTDDNRYWLKNVTFSETNRAVAWTPSAWDIADMINSSNNGAYNLLDGTAFDDMSPWGINPTYAKVETGIMPNGVKNAILTVGGTSGTYSDFVQRIPVEPNTEYTLSFNGGGTFSTFLWEKKADNTPTAVYMENKTNYSGKAFDMSSPRTDFGTTIRTQPDATFIQFIFRVTSNGTGSTSGRIGLIKLEKGSKATDWTPSVNDIRNMVNNIVIGGNNIIPNSVFKTLGKWRNWGTTGGTRTPGVAVDLAGFGTGFQFDAPAAGEYGYALDNVAVTQGETYTLSAWFKMSKDGIIKVQEGDSNVKWTMTSTPAVIGKWIRIVHTFVAKGSSTSIYIGQDGTSPASAGIATGVQLERGNKATDWSLATEDINDLISNTDKKAQESKDAIANMSSDSKLTPVEKVQLKKEWATMVAEKPQYESLATSFGITTEKNAFVTAYNTLNTILNTTPGYLKNMQATDDINGATFRGQFDDYYDKKAQLTKKINNVLQGNIDGIKVGGSNILRYTSFVPIKNWNGNPPVIENDFQGSASVTLKRTNFATGNPRAQLSQNVPSIPNTSVGSSYSISAWVYVDSSIAMTTTSDNNLAVRFYRKDNAAMSDKMSIDLSIIPKNTWTYVSASVTLDVEVKPNVEFMISLSQNGFMKMSRPQLEEGTRPSSWSPAPADIDELISGADKKAQDSKDAIANMSSDSKLTPVEKVQLKKEWSTMTAEKPQYEALANGFGITTEKNNFVTAYNTLNTNLNTTPGYLKNMQTTDDINGATFRAMFDDYYSKLAILTKKINETIQGNVDGINVGGRNLILESTFPITNSTDYLLRMYTLSENFIAGQEYTFMVKGTVPAGQKFGIWQNGGSTNVGYATTQYANGVYYVTFKAVATTAGNERKLSLYNVPQNTTQATVEWVALYKGNKPMDWSPAPEDITGLISNTDKKAQESKDAIANMSSDSKLTPVEKVQLKKEWATMVAEKPQYEALANSFAIGTEKTNYVNAYNTLNNVLNTTPGYLKNMQATDDINGTTFRGQFDDYYDRKAQLIKKINETIQGNVNNINVGGRNVLLGTGTPATIVGTNTTNQGLTIYNFAGGDSKVIIAAASYCVTFDWKIEGTPGGTMYLQGSNPWPVIADKITFSTSNTSGRYSAVKTMTGAPFTGVNIRLDNVPVGAKVTISNLKIETGNKATDWSPAPEDIDQQMIDGVIYMRGTGLNHTGNRILQVSGKTIYDATGRGLRLTALKKSDLSVVFDQTYDVYATPSDPIQVQVADKINSFATDMIITLTSQDAIAITKPELLQALQTIGGSGTPQNGRVPFALLGLKGLGTGAGIEVYGTTDAKLSSNSEIFTRVIKGVVQGINSGTGAVADRVAKAEATITNLGTEIDLRVSKTDFTGNTISSLINQTATTIKIKANQIQLEGYVTFDMIAGGTIKLGGANNVNGRMEIFDKNGESVGMLSAEDGGFSRLSIDYLTAKNVLQMTSQNHPNYRGGYVEIWVDGENGSNNASGVFGDPVRSIQEAINRLPKYLAHNVEIKIVPCFYSENLDISGFKGIGGIKLMPAHYNVRWARLSTTGTITSAGATGPASLYVRTLAAYTEDGVGMKFVSATSNMPGQPNMGPAAAIDDDWGTYTDLYGGVDGNRRYLTADLGKVYERVGSFTFWLSNHNGQAQTHKNVLLEVSEDNKTWRKVKEYPTWNATIAGYYGHFTMTGKITIRQCDDITIQNMFNDFSYNNAGGAIVESYSSKVIIRGSIMNGGANNEQVIFAHHSDFECHSSELNKAKNELIFCGYGTVATMTANTGGDAPYAYTAGTASHVSGWGSTPWGNSSYGRGINGGIINGDFSNDNRTKGVFTSSPPPPPPAQFQTITRTWTSYHCDSYGYFLGSSRWKPDEDVPLQGKYADYGQWKGCWFFPDDMWNTIYGGNVTEIQSVRVWVGRINGAGNGGNTDIFVRTHPHQSKPGGDPSMSSGVNMISLPRGGGGWVDLTGNNMDNFRINSKWARGIAVYAASDNTTYYAKMQNECYVEVTYKVKI
jgi:hypothetical protein